MRISDWSSDVCSSDLAEFTRVARAVIAAFFGDKTMRAFIGRLPRCVVSGMMVATCVAAPCAPAQAPVAPPFAPLLPQTAAAPRRSQRQAEEKGRASRQERRWKYVMISGVAESIKKKTTLINYE